MPTSRFYKITTDQDSLNAAAGGNLLTKTPRDALKIIENKSKVCTLRNKPVVSKVSDNTSSTTACPSEMAALTNVVNAMLRHVKTSPSETSKQFLKVCIRTRSSSNLIAKSSTTPKRHNRTRSKKRVEPFSLEETSVVTMADQRTMAELLQAPTEGYGDAIVTLIILAENFELKHGLLNLVTLKQFYGFEKEDPHAHIRWFNKITSTIKYKDVPNSSIKLMLFPFSIEVAAQIWLKKEPPRSILTWEDLVSKFINQFFPPSKTTNLRN
ncbi:hypothetical protein Tco_0233470 [Tanacetum coccineum]